MILGFACLMALAAATSLVQAKITDIDLWTTAQIGRELLCVLPLLAIARHAQALQAEARADTVLRHLAHGNLSDPQAFLAGLQGIAGVDEAFVLSAIDLGDFDQPRTADPTATPDPACPEPPGHRRSRTGRTGTSDRPAHGSLAVCQTLIPDDPALRMAARIIPKTQGPSHDRSTQPHPATQPRSHS